jgi:iron complex outermembrane recepter protein
MRITVAIAIACFSLLGFVAISDAQATIRKPTFIPPQKLGNALKVLAKERGFQIVYVSSDVDAVETQGASGDLTSEEALLQLLRGTGLTYRNLDEAGGVTIVPTSRASRAAPVPEATRTGLWNRIRLAQAEPTPSTLPASSAQSPETSGDETLEEVIVTGVFSSRTQRGAAVAVTTLDTEQLRQLAPVSAADYLKDVPGVFVNSALGEIRNIVYTRGINANSQDGNNGYFYTSLQEDGLPVQNVLATNNGPDYYARPDIFTRRIEAVRGGASAIAGPNAPGGIFNYISSNGRDNPGTEIRGRFGYEGDGAFDNPYYRADLYNGGELTENLYYAIGGFYRDATGPRDPGYSMNRGGQVRGNLRFLYEQGALQLNAKYLDDHNLWDEFLPVQGFDDPRPLGTFDFNSSVNPPRMPHSFPAIARGFPEGQPSARDSWDPRQGIHSESKSIGLNWDHRFTGGWSLSNKLKYSDNHSDWNSGAAIFAMSVDEPGIYGPAPFGNGILAVGTSGPAGVAPFTGTISFTSRSSGQVLARVQSTTDAAGNPVFNLLGSSLPDDPALPNAILFQTAYAVDTGVDEVMDQFVLTKAMDKMTFDFGAFFASSDFEWRSGEGGVGISQFTPARELMDISILRDGADDPAKAGVLQQVTGPDGFAGLGKIGSFTNFAARAEQEQISLFFGHSWTLTDRVTLDSGVRYETIDVEGTNQSASQFTDTNGGLDGNPDTLFDNTLQRLNPPTRYEKSFNYWAYSPAISYEWNDRQSTYVRYARSKKAPSLSAFVDPIDGVNEIAFIPESVQQFEIGHTLRNERYAFTVTPFYTKLENVGGFGSPVQFTDVDGTNYVRPPPLSNVKTKGVELEGTAALTQALDLRLSFTYADSDSTDNAVWEPGQPGRDDDFIRALPDGEALNQPNIIASATGSYRFGELAAYATFRHMGERQANASNTFQLPAYNVLDLGAQYDVTPSMNLSFLVKNVANSRGILSWQGVGGFDGLDRSRTPSNEVFSVVTVQPRAYFITANLRL